jgi:hypothetical protein
VVAAFFDLPAYVFAPAPFGNAALDQEISVLNPIHILPGAVSEYFQLYSAYQTSKGRTIDPSFDEYASVFAGYDGAAETALYQQREGRVTGTYIQGEVVQYLRAALPSIGDASLVPIDIGASLLDNPVDLHNMLLHAAFAGSEGLVVAAQQVPALWNLMLDEALYAQGNQSSTMGFLNRLLSRQLATGVSPGAGPLDRFAAEILLVNAKIGATDQAVRDGLAGRGPGHGRGEHDEGQCALARRRHRLRGFVVPEERQQPDPESRRHGPDHVH